MRRAEAALLAAVVALLPLAARPASSVLDGVMARMAALPARQARFVEEKRLSSLTVPLVSRGRLVFRPPAHLEKDTEAPLPEQLVIDADTVTLARAGEAPHIVPLDQHPALRALADTLRAALGGDLATLRRLYAVQEMGGEAAWRLLLVPTDGALRRALARVTIDGSGTEVLQIDIQQENGDEQRMTVAALP